jgi:Fur family transcriptional regulator, ferric uptake regulator
VSPVTHCPTTPANARAQAGLRRTRAATAVLDILCATPLRAYTHADIDAALQRRGVVANRVTIYRLLERLVDAGLLDKHTDHADRTWRFGWRTAPADTAQARFECDACHRHFQLPEASEPTKAAADQIFHALSSLGHQGQRVDLSIHGTCAGCADPTAHG